MSRVKTFCALQVLVLELISYLRFFASFQDPKNTSLFSSLNWGIRYWKDNASLHENTNRFDRAQINAHDAMEFAWGNPRLTNTTNHCTRTRRNLTKRRQTGTMEFDQAQPNDDGGQKYWSRTFAHAHALTRASIKFSKGFFVPKVSRI